MEWRDKACFEAHNATPHVKHAEDRLKREKMLIEPAKEWHFYRLIDGPQGRGYKNSRVSFTARQTIVTRAPFISFCRCGVENKKGRISRT
jgi:hypothetical protein